MADYVKGYARTKTSQYGEFTSIYLSDINELMSKRDEKGGVSININKRREVDKYGNDLSMIYNTWKPKSDEAKMAEDVFSQPIQNIRKVDVDISTIPF